MSKRNASKGKRINPHFWVFCEGKTEDAYIRFLRSEYRIPVEIISKVAGASIDERYIKSYKKGKPTHEKDKNFLVYDGDVGEVLDKLKNIDTATLVTSNPTIELWFLLHYKSQTAALTGDACIRELSNRNKNLYKKGVIDAQLKSELQKKFTDACRRSKTLELYKNPSTNMHVFIEALDAAKNEK
jgi:hypothetical protein